eukprot:570804-Amphidinium_carterae.1
MQRPLGLHDYNSPKGSCSHAVGLGRPDFFDSTNNAKWHRTCGRTAKNSLAPHGFSCLSKIPSDSQHCVPNRWAGTRPSPFQAFVLPAAWTSLVY